MAIPLWLERLSGETMGALVLACAALCAFSYILLRSPVDSPALTIIAGCYVAPGQPTITVSPVGELTFVGEHVRVVGSRDKVGIALSPEHMVMIDRQDHDRLEIDTSYPQLLRYDESQQELEIPDFRGGAPMTFHRNSSPCASAGRE